MSSRPAIMPEFSNIVLSKADVDARSITSVHEPDSGGTYVPFLFSASIFLYPFAIAGHSLYMIPQSLLIVAVLAKIRWHSLSASRWEFAVGIFALFSVGIAGIVEISAETPKYDLVSKLIVNGFTLSVLAVAKCSVVSRRTAGHLFVCVILWAILALVSYVRAGTTVQSLALTLVSSDSIGSTTLYQLASPLETLFLTKNITAMFFVAVFSTYLCLHLMYGSRLSTISVLVFLFTIAIFASRQALLSSVVVFVIYRYLRGISVGTILVILGGVAIGSAFFLMFFDLESGGDGANQRLDLYRYFFEHFWDFALTGYGMDDLNQILGSAVGIDNFHMFFMNQIGAYGLLHFVFYSCLCLCVIYLAIRCRPYLLLISAYYLNVLFQTFGYEYGNLFLFMIIVSQSGATDGRGVWRQVKGARSMVVQVDGVTTGVSMLPSER